MKREVAGKSNIEYALARTSSVFDTTCSVSFVLALEISFLHGRKAYFLELMKIAAGSAHINSAEANRLLMSSSWKAME